MVLCEVGQDVHIEGGLLSDAVDRGVRKGYEEGYLRKSVVRGPFDRVNTGDKHARGAACYAGCGATGSS